MEHFGILIIGAGPAGLMAAYSACRHHTQMRIGLLESGPEVARKLNLTGGGRGNVTRTDDVETFVRSLSKEGRFLYPALQTFGCAEIRSFFTDYGCSLKEEDHGRLFPESERASDLSRTLQTAVTQLGGELMLNHAVTSLEWSEPHWHVSCHQKTFSADRVILAGGSVSFPATGSDGSCASLALKRQIPFEPFSPALHQVKLLDHRELTQMSGISLWASISYQFGGAKVKQDEGDLLFTHQGLSGPLIKKHSRILGRKDPRDGGQNPLVQEGTPEVQITLNLLPSETSESLADRLNELRAESKPTYLSVALDRCPKALLELGRSMLKIPSNQLQQWNQKQVRAFSEWLCRQAVNIQVAPIGGAVVCRGGIQLKAVDPQTLAIKNQPGLYACGEILNLDGPSGGYNLTMAFATGYLAGLSAAQREIEDLAT